MTEGEWMLRLMRHLNRPHSGIRVWRQQAGKIRDSHGHWVHCAPKGAADLVGISAGIHLEIECKVDAPWTADQRRWGRLIESRGGIYVLARLDANASLESELQRVESLTRRAA
jgi:hypothetical protein